MSGIRALYPINRDVMSELESFGKLWQSAPYPWLPFVLMAAMPALCEELAFRGFVLSGFPASVVQAMVFDQWLDERDDSLTACLWLDETGTSTAVNEVGENRVAAYYRDRGLLFQIPADASPKMTDARILNLVGGLVADR